MGNSFFGWGYYRHLLSQQGIGNCMDHMGVNVYSIVARKK
ncbi:hypothetical protein SAMN02745687_02457 [Lachnospiraceae bacterium NK3A20]|nr:hypothetical protein SAMN02745687_02457 [Lachnospiraceae bacterium NK3A20]